MSALFFEQLQPVFRRHYAEKRLRVDLPEQPLEEAHAVFQTVAEVPPVLGPVGRPLLQSGPDAFHLGLQVAMEVSRSAERAEGRQPIDGIAAAAPMPELLRAIPYCFAAPLSTASRPSPCRSVRTAWAFRRFAPPRGIGCPPG
jgi:hypothetical protein